MNFDLRTVPFSRYGSFWAISELSARGERDAGLYLRSIRGGDERTGELFRIELVRDGKPVAFKAQATPALLRLEAEGGGIVELCLPEPGEVRVRGQGAGLRLSMRPGAYDHAVPQGDGVWEINSYSLECRFALEHIQGLMRVDAPWEVARCRHIVADITPAASGEPYELAIAEYRTVRKPALEAKPSFGACAERVSAEWSRWLAQTMPVPDDLADARELAAYITWSCVVEQGGHLPRQAMYMSKNWMTNIWSWDHCFNTMALARTNPDLAWDQFMIFFDVQHEDGMLPDFMNDKFALWNATKPPIHGWTLGWMMDNSDTVTDARLREVYEPLCRWTRWWLEHRTDRRIGLPCYYHGNDSGWDNSTVFGAGTPVASPDLSAYLVLQMEVLSRIAERLGKPSEAGHWREQADALLQAMLRLLWNGERFVALRPADASGSGEAAATPGGSPATAPDGGAAAAAGGSPAAARPAGESAAAAASTASATNDGLAGADSLLLFVPIVLGNRLPEPVRASLVRGLQEQGRFLTGHGLATESTASPYYRPDGYWRGPIWAPSSMLLIDGLHSAGELGLAQSLARKYCAMAARSGMAENYDALTGDGLRDRAFTWTSSVFLVLASRYL